MLRKISCDASTSLYAVLVLFGAQLLIGCATTTMAPVPSKAAPKDNEGIVVLSITGNTGQVGQIEYVNLKREDNPGKVENIQILRNVAAGLARDTALFVGVIPAGTYSLKELHVGVNYLSFGEGARQLIGDLRVEQGAVADLGRIVMTPLNARILTGRSKLITSNAELIKKFSPENAWILAKPAMQGWVTPHSKLDITEDYALRRPVGANTPSELASGEIIVASRLGTLLIRNNVGRWRAARAETLNSFLAVLPISSRQVDGMDAVAVAVGEFNTIARLDAKEKMTLLDPGNLPPGNLINLQGNADVGWYVAHQQNSKVVLYRAEHLDKGDWREVRSENIAFSFWSGANSFWMWPTERGFAYAISEGSIHNYHFKTKTWSDSHAPNKNRLIAIAPAGETLGVLTSPGGGFGGMFASMYMSYDRGMTWETIKSPYKVKMYAPRALINGTLLVAGGGMYAKEELQASEDHGQTWRVRSDKIGFKDDIVVLPSGGLLAIDAGASFGLASIAYSSDNGATWKVEYSNFDRSVYELQKK